MPAVHVCPLSRVAATVEASRASHLVSFVGADQAVARPATIAAERHLVVGVNDIVAPLDGMVLAGADHVAAFVAFVGAWDRVRPLVIHCHAGISRSTAGAFIALCALRPDRDEASIATALRAASPSATPNRRLVALADDFLGRSGRMTVAIEAIGRGANAYEGEPFHLALGA